MENRIQTTFKNLNGKKALITYITCGDPDLDTTLSLMHSLVDGGADIIELGVPFSDPMADGAVIQRASERALNNGVSLQNVLEIVQRFRQINQTTAVVLMGYLNPIYRMGYASFATAAKLAGVDGVLVVDCPEEYAQPLYTLLSDANIKMIFLLAPTSSLQRIKQVAQCAGGFVYYVSLRGVTGSGSLNIDEVSHKISELRKEISLPIAVGFGIKNAQTAKDIASCADAVVVGSRIIEVIEENLQSTCEAVRLTAKELKEAISI